jgi:glucosyl-dolichyl phosphate glucuronosyltransferase
MKISVILCTRNRCRSLEETLRSAAALKLPASDEWELLIVDNNSSDRTRDVANDFCRRLPRHFRYVLEPQQGKSTALNTGIRAAVGDVLAFTDDDVVFDAEWLGNLTAPLKNGEWAGVGGRTLPKGTASLPRWLPRDPRHGPAPLALFDRGPAPCELNETPFGNNVAYRKQMFLKYGGFRVDLGPRPGLQAPQKGEDSEFGRRLLDAGERLRYEPSAVLYHEVPERRLQKSYFLDWWFDKARTDVRAFGTSAGVRWRVRGIPLACFRRLALWSLRWLTAVEPSRRFSNKLNVWITAGTILECYRQNREQSHARQRTSGVEPAAKASEHRPRSTAVDQESH